MFGGNKDGEEWKQTGDGPVNTDGPRQVSNTDTVTGDLHLGVTWGDSISSSDHQSMYLDISQHMLQAELPLRCEAKVTRESMYEVMLLTISLWVVRRR